MEKEIVKCSRWIYSDGTLDVNEFPDQYKPAVIKYNEMWLRVRQNPEWVPDVSYWIKFENIEETLLYVVKGIEANVNR